MSDKKKYHFEPIEVIALPDQFSNEHEDSELLNAYALITCDGSNNPVDPC